MEKNNTNELNIFSQISFRIIMEQANIVGSLAWDEAFKVPGLHIINKQKGEFAFDGNAKDVLDNLVLQYEKLFGKLSHEVSRESVQDLIAELPEADIPSSLK
ncbi:hypothetical protein K8Q94_01800 [Candidatus Nomurabacteria bacterium]|nr:hypothetical protein [Candidatus Nomurabacteria bacterium]